MMEFYEKLQELRKERGMTQEELAEALYVSRAAISKWESGRGYPSIDSLKEISLYFSVSIDDLLSSDKLLSIAEKENKENLRNLCDFFFGVADVCSCLLLIVPLYPNRIDGFVELVNLFSYTQIALLNRFVYWILFLSLILVGIVKLWLTKHKVERCNSTITIMSMLLSILAILIMAVTREAYALVVIFVLFVMKGLLLLK